MIQVTLISGTAIYLEPTLILSVRTYGTRSAIEYTGKDTSYVVTETAAEVNALIDEASVSAVAPIKSTNNSTTTPLNAAATWTGTGEIPTGSDILVAIETDQEGTYTIQVSQDDTNYITIGSYTYRAGTTTNRPHKFVIGTRYYKVSFENTSASNQTYLRISTSMGNFNDLTVPFNGTVARDADTSLSIPLDFNLVLAEGKMDGYENYSKFGYNNDLDTGDGSIAIWSAGVAFTPQTTADTYDVVSSSTADTNSSGTGARTITINGLNASGEDQDEIVELDGTTPVTTTNTFLGINRIQVITAGTGQTNAGNITLTETISTNVQGYVPLGTSVTQQLIFYIRSDAKTYIKGLEMDIAKPSGGGSPKVTITAYNLYNGIKYNLFQTVLDTADGGILDLKFTNYIKLNGGCWWMEAETTANDTFVRGRVDQTLVDD